MVEEDRELLFAYSRRGDVKSLSVLVERHAVWMQAFLRGFLASAADAEDAFQEAWVRVIKSAGAYRGGSVRAYLAAAARSAAIDRLRRRLPVLEPKEGEEALLEIQDPGPTPCERFESKATAEEVRQAVLALPVGPRQVFLMRVEGELAFKEIAFTLGKSEGWSKMNYKRAIEKLRQMIKKD